MEIRDSSANFLIEADLFRDFVIELAKLPDPNPPITAKLPAGRALNRLIDQAWAMVDKSVATDYATDKAVASFAAGLAVAAADLKCSSRGWRPASRSVRTARPASRIWPKC